jgi:lipid-A-disaccharide synthase
MRSKLIWIFAGEASGDLYGARLVRELAAVSRGGARIACMGGPEMKKAGAEIIADSSEMGVVGGVELVGKFFKIASVFLGLVKRAAAERPDLVVLIDYPGFNIRFAKKMRALGIPVLWYISPQVWAWRKSNIPKLAERCRKMMVIFPFEPDVYKGSGLETEFTGHPLAEIVRERRDPALKRDPDLVILLPGSRGSETSRLFKPMLEAAALLYERRPGLKFVVSAPRKSVYDDLVRIRSGMEAAGFKTPPLSIECGRTDVLLQTASAGLAASGTVTVECAIAGVPLVVAYRLHPFSFFLARRVIKIKLFRGFFTMVNVIADREIFQEFLQFQVTPRALADAFEKIMPGGERRAEVERGMAEVTDALSLKSRGASRRAAEICWELANECAKHS